MRKLCVGTVVVLSLLLNASAAFKLPKSVYHMDNIDAAKKDAKSKGIAVTFIFTDERTTCGLCAGASLNAADQLDKKTVVIYAECNTDWALIPSAVQQALNRPEAGKFIPKTVIVDNEMSNVVAIVPYAAKDEYARLLKEAKRKLFAARSKTSPTAKPTSPTISAAVAIPLDESREMREWQPRSKTKLTASLLQEDGASVVLKKENGSKVKILKYELSKDDQNYIKDLKQTLSEQATGNTPQTADGAAKPAI